MARVRVEFNSAEYARLLRRGGDLDQAVERAAGKTRDRARVILTRAGRIDTGRLRQSIHTVHKLSGGDRIIWEVRSNLDYAIFQELGTRAHGPRTARVLRFKPKGSGTFVFAQRVRGVTAASFLRGALAQLSERDFE